MSKKRDDLESTFKEIYREWARGGVGGTYNKTSTTDRTPGLFSALADAADDYQPSTKPEPEGAE